MSNGSDEEASRIFGMGRRVHRRLRALVSRRRVEAELDDELRFHLDMEMEHQMRMGLPEDAARRQARAEFGNATRYREESREARGVRFFEDLMSDVKVSLRSLRRTPGFALVSILTVALGVGMTTAVFSLIDGTLLRQLPYRDPAALIRIYERSAKYPTSNFSGANFRDLERETKTLQPVAFFSSWPQTVLGFSEPVRLNVAAVSARFFDVLGVLPSQGRTFLPNEGQPGTMRKMVISDRFWRGTMGARSDWRSVVLHADGVDGEPVGIMPPEFNYPTGADIWTVSTDDNQSRTAHNWSVIGRLKPGRSADDTRVELNHLFGNLKTQLGKDIDAEGVTIRSMRESLTFRVRTLTIVLLSAVGLVLLVACINLASANLARGESQQRELAVRASLGASRTRLIRQLATEKVILCGIGGVLSIGLAWLFVRAGTILGAGSLPAFAPLRVDGRVMAFALGVAILTGLVTGVLPGLRITADLRGAATNGGGGSGTRNSYQRSLIATEIALATMLLIGAGLFLRSFKTLLSEDPGYRVDQVLLTDLMLPAEGYADAKTGNADTLAITRFFGTLLDRVRSTPGIDGAALVSDAPLGDGGGSTSFMIDGGSEAKGNADYRVVDSAYFATMQIPTLNGRGFTSLDKVGTEHVVIINRETAEKYWPGANPIGHRIRPPGMDAHSALWLTVIGIVENVRQSGLDQPVSEQMYVHYLQRPERLQSGTIVVRARNAPAAAAAMRETVRAIDRNVLSQTSAMQTLVNRSVAGRRFSMTVLSAFSGLALFLAAVGIYGVVAYAVAQRRREIGVRMALGATGSVVRRLIVTDALYAVVPGLAVGLLGALFATRTIASMLYGIAPVDPLTFAITPVVILLVSIGASLWPAARASRIDPLIAMRAD